jgi:hypothetical protein
VINSLVFQPTVPNNSTAIDCAFCRRLHLLEGYNVLVQDIGYEDPILDACVHDLLMPYTPARESLHEFYHRLYAAEQVIHVNESICDGTYQPPNPIQSINSIPTYNTLYTSGTRQSSPARSVASTTSDSSSSTTDSISPLSSSRSPGQPNCTVHVQSVTDEDDDHTKHEQRNVIPPASQSPVVDAIGQIPSTFHLGQEVSLPPALRPYIPGHLHE